MSNSVIWRVIGRFQNQKMEWEVRRYPATFDEFMNAYRFEGKVDRADPVTLSIPQFEEPICVLGAKIVNHTVHPEYANRAHVWCHEEDLEKTKVEILAKLAVEFHKLSKRSEKALNLLADESARIQNPPAKEA